jgi:hypothetical protein
VCLIVISTIKDAVNNLLVFAVRLAMSRTPASGLKEHR